MIGSLRRQFAGLFLGGALLALPSAVGRSAEELTLGERPLYASLSRSERLLVQEALQQALENRPSREIYRWVSSANGASGFITPLRTFKIETGHYCRQFMEAVAKQGDLASAIQTACRSEDGRWIVVKR